MGLSNIYVEKICEDQNIAASGNYTSREIRLQDYQPEGFISLQLEVSGNGTLKVEPLLSVNGDDYFQPSNTPDITTNFTATSGPDGNGKDIFAVELGITCPYLKLKFTETGGSNSITVSAWLAIQ